VIMNYIHQIEDWPRFTWDSDILAPLLADVRYKQGRLLGQLEGRGFKIHHLHEEASLATLTEEVVKSSAIEGEKLDAEQVRSSIARHLGMDIGGTPNVARHIDGIVEMMLDATQNHDAPLTADRLFDWHAAIFPTGRSGMRNITVGGWRTPESGPMRVVSGPMGREKVHFEAPEAELLPNEMNVFLDWFNTPSETHSRMAMAGSRAPSLKWLWHERMNLLSDTTACRHKLNPSAMTTTRVLSNPKD
jgi:Fic family protein